jgi:hypothetical protein
MKKYLVMVALLVCLSGCTWEQTADNAEKTAAGAGQAEKIATIVSPLLGPYATLAALVAGAVGTVATGLKNLADSKKKRNLAKAAITAAEMVDKGGSAISTAAVLHGAQDEITTAYEEAIKTGLIKKG